MNAQGRPEVETIEAITGRFPHWFTPVLSTYADRVEELPIDQHQLLALCAPAPTLIWAGAADLWADPEGTFHAVEAAGPVFSFLGANQPPLTAPAVGEVSSGTLACGLRSGGHTVTGDDWVAWRHWCSQGLRRSGPYKPGESDAEDAPALSRGPSSEHLAAARCRLRRCAQPPSFEHGGCAPTVEKSRDNPVDS